MIRVSILGATGYSGGELIRLLLNRPDVIIQRLTSESSADKPVASVHPSLRGRLSLLFEKLDVRKVAQDSDVAFSCYPPGVGIKSTAQLIKAGIKVIDLSADFRLPKAQMYLDWYKWKHTAPALLKNAVYGLPELFRLKIPSAGLIANPGCYATAAILPLLPLLRAKIIEPASIIVDAKSGVSGAGKKVMSQYMFAEVEENFQSYAIASHRHQPEIEHVLGIASGVRPTITFTPHLVPMNRGILSVAYATLKKPMKTKDIRETFREQFDAEPFVRVLPEGEFPQTKNVAYTNFCDIGVTQDQRTRRVVVVSAIDNLVKGAAGQAVQNMNLCFNRPETEGLL